MLTIAITGKSGSGKSTLSSALRDNGYAVINVDNVAKLFREKVKGKVSKTFGKQYIGEDGSIDSKKLALLVFSNKNELSKLNDIMFPLIKKEINKIIKEYRMKNTPILFFDIPILFNANFEDNFDKIILVSASKNKRFERLVKFRDVDSKIAKKQIDSILITKENEKKCDLIVKNDEDDNNGMISKVIDWIDCLKIGVKCDS